MENLEYLKDLDIKSQTVQQRNNDVLTSKLHHRACEGNIRYGNHLDLCFKSSERSTLCVFNSLTRRWHSLSSTQLIIHMLFARAGNTGPVRSDEINLR